MAELLRRFDEADAAHLQHENEALQAIMHARAQLPHDQYGTHARLADAVQFTDDPCMAACGVERAVRMLRVFY